MVSSTLGIVVCLIALGVGRPAEPPTPRSGPLLVSGDSRWVAEGQRARLKLAQPERLDDPRTCFVGLLLRAKGTGQCSDTLVRLGGKGLSLQIRIGKVDGKHRAARFNAADGAVVTVDHSLLETDTPNAIFVTWERDRYVTLFVNGRMVEFSPAAGSMPSSPRGVFTPVDVTGEVLELVAGAYLPSFTERFRLHKSWHKRHGGSFTLYPAFQYYNPIITRHGGSVRDPSEILHIDGRYWVYFTYIREPIRNGWLGDVYVSSCADTDNPACPASWSEIVKVVSKGDQKRDHDGTGAYTPDCFWDGRRVFVFYTGNNSPTKEGWPSWTPGPRAPEHIMVAQSKRPDGGFVKTPIHTPLTQSTRALGYDEATVPGGHETLGGQPFYDVSLINHGQCWAMPDGERRYYYKGGGGSTYDTVKRRGTGNRGAICLIRDLDENWLNGRRHDTQPILRDAQKRHLEGILITRVDERLFLQLQTFDDRRQRLWETWISPADDGINWQKIGGGHRPKPGDNYPLSIGVYPTVDPLWAIGQFRASSGAIELVYLIVL